MEGELLLCFIYTNNYQKMISQMTHMTHGHKNIIPSLLKFHFKM